MCQCHFCEDWFHFEHMNPNWENLIQSCEESETGCILMCRNCFDNEFKQIEYYKGAMLGTDQLAKLKSEKDSSNQVESKSPSKNEISQTETQLQIQQKETQNDVQLGQKRKMDQIEHDPEQPLNPQNDSQSSKELEKVQKLSKPNSSNIEEEKEIKISKPTIACTKPKQKLGLNGIDLVLKSGFQNTLCKCPECKPFLDKIEKQMQNMANIGEEEKIIQGALDQEDFLIEDENPEELSQPQSMTSQGNMLEGLVTDRTVKMISHLDQHKKQALLNGIQDFIRKKIEETLQKSKKKDD